MRVLDGTSLKLIAIVSMTVDHIGYLFFPDQDMWRIIGRFAFPVFAWMIAEGCFYTRNIKMYFLRVSLLAAVCQAVYTIADGTFYMSVLVTFTLAILLIMAYQRLERQRTPGRALIFACAFLGDLFLTAVLPHLISVTGFAVDYGFFGSILPLTIYAVRSDRRWQMAAVLLNMLLMCIGAEPFQIWGLLAPVLFLFYNGKPGRYRMKYLFYVYYPAHLVVLYGISLLVQG